VQRLQQFVADDGRGAGKHLVDRCSDFVTTAYDRSADNCIGRASNIADDSDNSHDRSHDADHGGRSG
jgi:hypothetical protein